MSILPGIINLKKLYIGLQLKIDYEKYNYDKYR